ncbi:MAG: hypothetical protein MJ181_06495 [Treponema sp.]|nr:hypothetical protein [Treponema sp.]
MKRFGLIITVAVILVLASCKTTGIQDIPTDLTAAQLLQKGQDAEAANQYKNAEAYFMATIQRFGLDNAIYVEARYELGNCFLKEKKYDSAKACFTEIVSIYENAAIGTIPPAYLKLAQIGLNKIPE